MNLTMKKIIFFGFIIIAIITINISQLVNSSDERFSFNQLINIAFADNENGGGECFTVLVNQGGYETLCPNSMYYQGQYWEEVACSGSGGGTCQSGIIVVVKKCDGTEVRAEPDDSNCPQ